MIERYNLEIDIGICNTYDEISDLIEGRVNAHIHKERINVKKIITINESIINSDMAYISIYIKDD
jgi:hypothetical protein